MKKTLLLSTILLAATSAFAFGGVFGGGHKSHSYNGVDSIGVHYNGKDNKPNIDIRSCDSETEELVGTECLPKCPEGLGRNTDGTCTVCASGNVYLSYNVGAECDTATPMNQTPCETDNDCKEYPEQESYILSCCDLSTHTCRTSPNPWSIYEDFTCPTENKPCISNKDCAQNEFCNVVYTTNWQIPDVGSCLPLEDGIERSFNDETYLVNETPLSFWAAQNWCRAHGRHMVNLSDLGVTQTCEDVFDSSCWSADWEQIQNLSSLGCIVTTDFYDVGDAYVVWDGEEVTVDGGFHQCDGWMNLTVCR